MKFLLLSVAYLCLLAQIQAQGGFNLFGRFFGNNCARNPCSTHATCRNVGRSYICACDNGYTGNAYGSRCFDINECLTARCPRYSTCVNTGGSYRCRCNRGYTMRSGRCRRIVVPTTTTTTTTSTTTTRRTRTTTRTTTRHPSDLNLCNNRNRTWSECIGNPPTRITIDGCAFRSQVCTDGVLLGNLFVKNFLAPPDNSGSQGSRTLVGARTLTGGGSSTSGNTNNTGCVVQYVRNARGKIITGRCVPPSRPSGGRSFTRSKRSVVQTKRDLLIMLDESYSVGRNRYEKVKRIAAAIVRLLCESIKVHPSYTRVAVTSFNGRVYFNIRLRSIRRLRYLDQNAELLAQYIFRYIYFHGGRNARRTCLISALRHGYNVALDSRYGGRRGNPRVEQDIIIISDGCENCVSRYRRPQQIREMTSFFIQQGIHVYVIGIGLTENCKQTLSLLAQGGRCFHFFYLTQWDYDVDDFIFQLENPPRGVCLNLFENPLGQCLAPL